MAQYETFEVDQGADLKILLTLTELDGSIKSLTQYTSAAQARITHLASDSDAVSFLTRLDSSAGTLQLELTNTQTSLLNAGRYFYDVELYHDSGARSLVERLLEGFIEVSPSVTR